MKLSSTPRRMLPVLALLLAGGLSLFAESGVTGFWVLKIPTGDGNFRETFFDLKQEGTAVTGKIVGNREMDISGGTFENGKLHFVVSFAGRPPMRAGAPPRGGMPAGGPPPRAARGRSMTYEATLVDGKLEMTVAGPEGTPEKGVAERTSPEAAKPPAPLPLPQLHDVPDNGLARTPPMGWNSWNLFARRIDDKTVREMADAMVTSGMRDAGYVYINIDDTWESADRDAQGNIAGNTKFPDMKALADYVHSKGLKIGIYSSPGPKTCASYEGSFGHEAQDAKAYAAWGIDYLKYDWCSAGRIYKDTDMRAVYQKMGDALQATGRPIVYSLCQYGREDVWKWGAKVGGNLWRTTGDIRDSWESMGRIGFAQPKISEYMAVGHWNDPDMLEIGNGGMNGDEYRTHMSLWSMLAAPLLAGNDLRNMSAETKSILMNREVIAVDQDAAANPVRTVSEAETAVVLSRQLHDGSVAVGLFNRGAQPAEISVNWASAGLGGKTLQVRDLWQHKNVSAGGAAFSAKVPAHGVVLLKATAAR